MGNKTRMGNEEDMIKAPLIENPRPQPCFYLSRDGNDFKNRDGYEKAFPVSSAPLLSLKIREAKVKS